MRKENDICGYNNSEVRHDGSLANNSSMEDVCLLKKKQRQSPLKQEIMGELLRKDFECYM